MQFIKKPKDKEAEKARKYQNILLYGKPVKRQRFKDGVLVMEEEVSYNFAGAGLPRTILYRCSVTNMLNQVDGRVGVARGGEPTAKIISPDISVVRAVNGKNFVEAYREGLLDDLRDGIRYIDWRGKEKLRKMFKDCEPWDDTIERLKAVVLINERGEESIIKLDKEEE